MEPTKAYNAILSRDSSNKTKIKNRLGVCTRANSISTRIYPYIMVKLTCFTKTGLKNNIVREDFVWLFDFEDGRTYI